MNKYATKIQKLLGKREALEDRDGELTSALFAYEEELVSLEEAQAFLQLVAKDTQEQLKFNIQDVVQLALDTCFPGLYEFDIKFEIKRDKTEATLVFLKDGMELDPMTASGGGLVDLTAFALRIAVWSLGKTDNVIILDEPFKWLQPRELQIKGIELIKQLSKKLGLQFIINSNTIQNEDLEYVADKIFRVSIKDGISKVVEDEK